MSNQNALTALDENTRDFAAQIKTLLNFQGTDNELALFAMVARRLGLDPLAKQVYAVFRGGKMTIQTGIDGQRAIGFRTGQLDAIGEPEFHNWETIAERKAVVSVWRKGSDRPTVGVAYWTEFCQTDKDGRPTGMWSKMPRTMLAKCAESQALRKAFPEALSGVYTDEEMSQADSEPRTHAALPAKTIEVIESYDDAEARALDARDRGREEQQIRRAVMELKTLGDAEAQDLVADSIKEFGGLLLSDLTYDQLAGISLRLATHKQTYQQKQAAQASPEQEAA